MFTLVAAVNPRRLLRLLATAAMLYWLALTFVMHVPLKQQQQFPDDGIPKDKTVHLVLYGGLAVCAICLLEQRSRVDPTAWPRRKLSRYLAAISFCVTHGIFEESTQPLTGRTFEYSDLLADCVGATLGLVGYFVASRLVSAMQRPEEAS